MRNALDCRKNVFSKGTTKRKAAKETKKRKRGAGSQAPAAAPAEAGGDELEPADGEAPEGDDYVVVLTNTVWRVVIPSGDAALAPWAACRDLPSPETQGLRAVARSVDRTHQAKLLASLQGLLNPGRRRGK